MRIPRASRRGWRDQHREECVQLDLFSESETLTKKQRRKKRKLSKKQIAARRKNNRSLNSWSFYRLTKFIEYKAALAGILVIRVDPYKTSQRCPHCGKEHKARDRRYECECGFHAHRDVVGAINIAKNAFNSNKTGCAGDEKETA